MVAVRRPRWPPCPYMVKTFKTLLLHNRGCLGAESLHESSGTGGQPKLLKELSYVDVWPFYGKVKFASLCICMSSIHLNGKIVKSFKRLLLWSLWPNFVQISHGATWPPCPVWGNKRLLKLSRSVTKMAAMPIYGKNLLKSSSPEPRMPWGWIFAQIIGNERSTKFAKRIAVRWHLTFLRQGQFCFPMHLYEPHTFE